MAKQDRLPDTGAVGHDAGEAVGAEDALALADAALGAAGHEMVDPVVREIGMRIATGEITGDEAIAELDALSAQGHFRS